MNTRKHSFSSLTLFTLSWSHSLRHTHSLIHSQTHTLILTLLLSLPHIHTHSFTLISSNSHTTTHSFALTFTKNQSPAQVQTYTRSPTPLGNDYALTRMLSFTLRLSVFPLSLLFVCILMLYRKCSSISFTIRLWCLPIKLWFICSIDTGSPFKIELKKCNIFQLDHFLSFVAKIIIGITVKRHQALLYFVLM